MSQRCRYLIGSAARGGMNFIRVWGGGGIEKQAFCACLPRPLLSPLPCLPAHVCMRLYSHVRCTYLS